MSNIILGIWLLVGTTRVTLRRMNIVVDCGTLRKLDQRKGDSMSCSLFQCVREIVIDQITRYNCVSYNSLIASSSLVYYSIASDAKV